VQVLADEHDPAALDPEHHRAHAGLGRGQPRRGEDDLAGLHLLDAGFLVVDGDPQRGRGDHLAAAQGDAPPGPDPDRLDLDRLPGPHQRLGGVADHQPGEEGEAGDPQRRRRDPAREPPGEAGRGSHDDGLGSGAHRRRRALRLFLHAAHGVRDFRGLGAGPGHEGGRLDHQRGRRGRQGGPGGRVGESVQEPRSGVLEAEEERRRVGGLAEADEVAVVQGHDALHGAAVDPGPVRGAEVLEVDAGGLAEDPRVLARHRPLGDEHRGVRVSAQDPLPVDRDLADVEDAVSLEEDQAGAQAAAHASKASSSRASPPRTARRPIPRNRTERRR
jgi:hypothetical protein